MRCPDFDDCLILCSVFTVTNLVITGLYLKGGGVTATAVQESVPLSPFVVCVRACSRQSDCVRESISQGAAGGRLIWGRCAEQQ